VPRRNRCRCLGRGRPRMSRREMLDIVVVGAGVVGEITVAGPTATDSYFNRDSMTRLAKIRENAGGVERIVHRMGDVGYLDEQGRLWFCGRKTHRVETASGPLYTEQVEPVFNTHPKVRRTALVGTGTFGAQVPLLWVELHQPRVGDTERKRIVEELREIGARHAHTAGIERFRFHPGFPVDIRHNAKIGREKLALQAQAIESR
ncbi:hypothetical protein AB4084_15400, partial [Lysobacter sp. 2RAB21]